MMKEKTGEKLNSIGRYLLGNGFTPAFFLLSCIYCETVFHIYAFGDARLTLPIIMSLPTAAAFGFIVNLFGSKTAKIMRYVFIVGQFLLFATQAVYFDVFSSMFSWSMVGMAGDVFKGFIKAVLIAILETHHVLILLFVPLVSLIIADRKLKPSSSPNKKNALNSLLIFVLLQAIAFVSLPIVSMRAYSGFDLYYNSWVLDLSAQKLGITTTTWFDLKNSIFGAAEKSEVPIPIDVPGESDSTDTEDVQTQPDSGIADTSADPEDSETADTEYIPPQPETEYNVIDGLDFGRIAEKSDNEEIKALCDYLDQLDPTAKNEYTGLFKGYNLVMICAESFSPMAVNKILTPTLYRLVNTGFVFDNYWTSYPSVTTNGEYSFLTGLFPDISKPKADGTFLFSANNTMNMTISSWFAAQGVQPLAYHPNTESYYGRNVTHPNLGYIFKGQESYPDLVGWPESDLTMIKDSIGEYIDSERFLVYLMSVSGHHNYKFGGFNDIADKNKYLVENIDWEELVTEKKYEEAAKAYLAANIELDRALEYLINELDKNGKLDKTVICLSTDHYPYGLNDDIYASMLGYESRFDMKYEGMERYKSNLIIWNSNVDTVHIDKPCCTVDVLPTLLNLFGFEYDSRLYSGRDIFSDSYGMAIMANESFVTDKILFNSKYEDRVYFIGSDRTIPEGYFDAYIQICKNRFAVAANIVEHDFFSLIPSEVVEKAQKK